MCALYSEHLAEKEVCSEVCSEESSLSKRRSVSKKFLRDSFKALPDCSMAFGKRPLFQFKHFRIKLFKLLEFSQKRLQE